MPVQEKMALLYHKMKTVMSRKLKCNCATSVTGFCPVHGPIDYSETTWSSYRKCWVDEHGAKVSGPPGVKPPTSQE